MIRPVDSLFVRVYVFYPNIRNKTYKFDFTVPPAVAFLSYNMKLKHFPGFILN